MLRTAVIGLGWWGRTIVQTMRDSAAMRIVAGVDPSPAAADAAANLGIGLLPDYDAVIADRDIDAVILCTPHTTHHGQILKAAAAGKHVFCEKPLCLTRRHAEEAVAACNAAGVVLAVGHERRFEPPIQELCRMARGGELGTLLQIEGNFSQDKFLSLPPDNWRLSPTEAPAGPMTATGIHLLDLSVSLLGPAESACVRVRQLGSPLVNGDTLAALIGFRSGASALLTAILATPFDGRFAVYGSLGWAEVRDNAHPEAPQGWTMTSSIRGREKTTRRFDPAPAVGVNLEAFAVAAQGGAPYPMPQHEMLGTIAALEAVFRSAKSGAIEAVEA